MPEICMRDIPDEIWEIIVSLLLDDDRSLERLSTVSNRLKHTLTISDSNVDFLPRIFSRFPNLKHISFNKFHGCPDSILRLISRSHLPLESLDLSKQNDLPDDVIGEMPTSSLSSIKSLKLCNLNTLDNFDLISISGLMPNLEELDLSYPNHAPRDFEIFGDCVGITDDVVCFLASKLCCLRKINLSGNFFISDRSVVSLSEKCPNLEELGVINCTFVTQKGVCYALGRCVNLRSLALVRMNLTDSKFSDSLCVARNLSVLEFSYMGISDELLFAIVKASIPLRKLTLCNFKEFTFVGILSLLRSYPSLDHLALEGVHWLTDPSIIDLSRFLSQANTVKLNFCSKLTSSAFFAILKNCPSLSRLEMEKAGMEEQAFAVNVYNPRIRALILGSNKTLSNECLEKIAHSCPNLEQLDISDCPGITRKRIGEIVRNCIRLNHLQMSGCGAIKSLGIDAELYNLEALKASGSGLNDEELLLIAKKCPGLMYLDIMSCTFIIAKAVKEVVQRCKRLREIKLHWCGDMDRDIAASMVVSRPSLRKICIPTENKNSLDLLHGCYVCGP